MFEILKFNMVETADIKIKIMKRMFTRETKARESLPTLDSNLLENDIYLKVQLKTLEDNMRTAAFRSSNNCHV